MSNLDSVPKGLFFKDFLYRCTYYIVKGFISFLGLLPSFIVRSIGNTLGSIIYATYASYRKRTLSNLFCCPALSNKTPEELRIIAKKSLQRLCITMLEYGRLQSSPIDRVAYCENPEQALEILKSGKGKPLLPTRPVLPLPAAKRVRRRP